MSRPVLIGAGQVTNRPAEDGVVEPLELMVAAARQAADDAGPGEKLWRGLDAVRVVNTLSRAYPRPASTVAASLGAPEPRRAVYTTVGGDSPQRQVTEAAAAIAAGREGLTLVVGAEAMESDRRRGAGKSLRGMQGDAGPMEGDDRQGMGPAEMALGLMPPAFMYPLFENALRARYGRPLDEHRMALATILARFSEVASMHPHAWFRDVRTAEQIATVGPANRMVAFPYTKLMNAILRVDQGAALLLAPEEVADEMGVAQEKRVYLWSGADCADVWLPFERPGFDDSPGMRLGVSAALEAAGLGADDIACFDLYSCFPCAVELACDALGIADDDARPLTVTGGLAAFGGPGNNYTTHAIATMVERLRQRPEDIGLCSGLGWYVTKHAVGVYSAAPPPHGFRRADTAAGQAAIDAAALRSPRLDAEGPCSVETYTVLCDRDGAPFAVPLVIRLDDGTRAVARAAGGPAEWAAFMEREVVGERGRLSSGGDVSLYQPE